MHAIRAGGVLPERNLSSFLLPNGEAEVDTLSEQAESAGSDRRHGWRQERALLLALFTKNAFVYVRSLSFLCLSTDDFSEQSVQSTA